MELVVSRYGLINRRGYTMLSRASKYWIALGATATTGLLCSNYQVRAYFTSLPVLKAKSPEDNSWISQLLTKKDSDLKPALSPEEISAVLLRQEFSRKTSIGNVSWFETNHYNANSPIEDRHCECYLDRNDAYFFGIFDGHSGWHCSESLRMRLPLYVSLAMMKAENKQLFLSKKLTDTDLVNHLGNTDDDCPSFELPNTFTEKQETLKSGLRHFAERAKDMVPKLTPSDVLKYCYLSLDRDITKEAIPDGKCNEAIWTGLSGAVVVGAYIEKKNLYIANTGDCRAVLGTKSNSGSWLAIPMSDDHTVDNQNEFNRITGEHPGEEKTVLRNNRLLGQLQPLRSFGDVAYKWSKELHRKVLDILYGQPIVPESIYLTPPYLTAQPEINHKVLADDDRFLILATDGLWDTVTSDMAVKIVGEHLDALDKGEKSTENAATKLIRYGLGGGSNYRLADMIRVPAYQKRNFHDDITVTVIFFDHLSLQSKL